MYFKVETRGSTLNGWFDGFCPSNGIADSLNKKAKGVWAQEAEVQNKLNALKNGAQAAEWENLKSVVRELDDQIKDLKNDLEKENAIAAAIGVDMTGLGAWCNGAVSKRKKAEESLREAEKALGEVQGVISTLEKQQTEGIKEVSVVITQNKQKIEALKNEIRKVQAQIEVFKAKRDNEQKELAINQDDQKEASKEDLIGKLKENAPLLIAGTLVLGTAIYVTKSKKSKKTKTAKTVEA